mmetsp:Transcript_9634/g.13468  ORF Transcript_9634/g.13468 Transcript_9634/m.13468 type:complete len:410 (-) Transcript_9634:406-1635(-)
MDSILNDADSDLPPGPIDESEVLDRMAVMREQEETVYRCGDYLGMAELQRKRKLDIKVSAFDARLPETSQSRNDPEQNAVDEQCRVKMCEWCYQVVDFCKFRRETVGIAMSYLDRYLFSGIETDPQPLKDITLKAFHDRRNFQLAAMTSLYIAIKLFEPLEMDTALLSQLSRGCYSTTEIAEMECNILTGLSWRVHGPTAHSFVQHMVALLPSLQQSSGALDFGMSSPIVSTLLDCATFQTEIAIGHYFFVHRRPSTIALSSIINALEGIDIEIFPHAERATFITAIANVMRIDPQSSEVLAVRMKLLEAFASSSGEAELTSTEESADQAVSTPAAAEATATAAAGTMECDDEDDGSVSTMTDSPTSMQKAATASARSSVVGKTIGMDFECDDSVDSSPICVSAGNKGL